MAQDLAVEIQNNLLSRDIAAGSLRPATKNIYLNKNFTDGERVFVKMTRSTEEFYWFNHEVKEAIVAHGVLEGKLLTPRPLIPYAVELSTGQHFSAWEYLPISPEKDSYPTKIAKMLHAVKVIADHTEQRKLERTLPLFVEGWGHTVERARDRLLTIQDSEIATMIDDAVAYIQESKQPLYWIHGDLHGANVMDKTGATVDWDGTQLSFLEWDLAHLAKEPFHHIRHGDWTTGETNFWQLMAAFENTFPQLDFELIRQSVVLRRACAILWKKSSQDFNLERWYTTLRWFDQLGNLNRRMEKRFRF